MLILLFGPVSGAHFNPVVSLADWRLGRRTRTGLTARVAAVRRRPGHRRHRRRRPGQRHVRGALSSWPPPSAPGRHLWLGEVVATAGLVALIFALARTGRGVLAAPAVGAYIGAAYWFTSSHLFANPRSPSAGCSPTPSPVSPRPRCPAFVAAQARRSRSSRSRWRLPFYPHIAGSADDVVIPQSSTQHPTRAQDPLTATHQPITGTPQVVFACVRNGGRSVTARVLAEHYAGDAAITALSAGTQPGEHIHPEVADASCSDSAWTPPASTPHCSTRDTVAASDLAITLGCGEECPYVPGVTLPGLARSTTRRPGRATVRRIVADLDDRVRALLLELVPGIELASPLVRRRHSRLNVFHPTELSPGCTKTLR